MGRQKEGKEIKVKELNSYVTGASINVVT